MARKIMKETWYTFDPATRTVTFPHYVPHEHLILITDITANKVIYNFSDPSLGYTDYAAVVNPDGTESTRIILKYNTSGLASSDEIQVTIDEYIEQFAPAEEYQDGVGKLKTSAPQALIDTDFEYGAQQSKWESISTINNRPASYGYPYNALNVSDITAGASGSRTVTVTVTNTTATVNSATGNASTLQTTYTTSTAHGFSVGQYVTVTGANTAAFNLTAVPIISTPNSTTFVVNSLNTGTSAFTAGSAVAGVVPPVGTPVNVLDTYVLSATGRYTVEARTSNTQFTYTCKTPFDSTWATLSLFDPNKTLIIQEALYSNAAIGGAPTMSYVSQAAGSPVTVTTTVAHGLSIGNEINVVGTSGVTGTNGSFSVATITSPTSFVYYTPSTLTGTLATTATATGAAASGTSGAIGSNIFSIGAITGAVSVGMGVSGVGIPSGAYVTGIATGSGATTSTVTLSSPLTAAVTATTYTFNAAIYVRPQGQVVHRAFDGGVLFQTNAGSNNQSLVRQTRRYFRYQSGKAISMSSGTILKPTLNIDSLTASATAIGSTVTVVTKEKHNFQPGYQVTIYGSTDPGYNGTFAVASVLGTTKFTYINTALLQSTAATGAPYVSTNAWYGAQTRLGIFDNQNGAYWEFDGQTVYAVRRSSVYQIQGRVSVTQGSATVTGSTQFATAFNKQLALGDWIVIRGQSYRVQDIASDTSLTIAPAYRGTSASQVVVSKTVNTKIPQSSFNIDQLDGHGPTGYNLDLSKMQMFFVDFTWYGAGSIRWGLRTNRGNIAWVHRMPNNNNNATAYMRSGNLPARYESATYPSATYITNSVLTTDTTMQVADTSAFPSSGTLLVRSGTAYEAMNYTGKTITTFTGLTRAQAGTTSTVVTFSAGSNTGTVASATGLQVGQRVIHPAFPDGTFLSVISGTNVTFTQAALVAASTAAVFPPLSTGGTAQGFTYSATAPVAVELAFPTYGPGLSHWGTSVIMDGRFDDDKSLLFTYGQTTSTQLAPAGTITLSNVSASASATLTLSTANTNIVPGMVVSTVTVGTGSIPDGTYVVSVTDSTHIVLNNTVTVAGTNTYTLSGASSKALMSIRIAPSVDNGLTGQLGQRELINRMQLILKALDISILNSAGTGNVLVQAFLNAIPNANPGSSSTLTNTLWTNAIKGALLTPNSSLAQVADYAGGFVGVTGGEVTGGFFTNSTGSIELTGVRDLGNSTLGGGTTYNSSGIYPDGPDTLTIVVTNLATTPVSVLGRLSWTEAQA